MSIDQVINILAAITLMVMMVAVGLCVTAGEVIGVARDWRLLIRAALANYVFVPAVATGLLLLLHASPLVAVGILIAAACPGAPFGPPFTALIKGNVVTSVGLMVVLAGSSALLTPLLLSMAIPLFGGDKPIRIDAFKMITILIGVQFLPLCAGLALRQSRPVLADRLKKPFKNLSMLLNLAFFGLIIFVQFWTLAEIRMAGYGGMFALLLVSLVIGWLLGGPDGSTRKAMSMATGVRNVGVAMVIATGSFAGTAVVTATTAFGLLQTIGTALIALAWGRMIPATVRVPVSVNT